MIQNIQNIHTVVVNSSLIGSVVKPSTAMDFLVMYYKKRERDSGCCVYAHILTETDVVFYIGVAVSKFKKRPYEFSNRNNEWKKITNGRNFYVKILYSDLDYKTALSKETEMINLYGRIDLGTGTLCNRTNGGFTESGRVFTDEHRKSIAERMKGKSGATGSKHKKEWFEKRCYKIIDTKTGVLFINVREAAQFYKIPENTLYRWLTRHKHMNKTNLIYYEKKDL